MAQKLILFIGLSLTLFSCHTNSVTGRSQLSLVSESEVQGMALKEYKSFLSSNTVVSAANPNSEMVKRVGSRIASSIARYYHDKGDTTALKNYNWEFNLVENKEVNAWCMPGGKVVVFTGILPVTQNETALAIVLGHEITHAVAGHGNERMSQQLLAADIQQAGDYVMAKDPKAIGIFNQVYAPGAQVAVLLPYSRKMEYEADHFGLIFAAMAGYDPQEAIPFWTRMSKLGGEKPPIFLSDHPADEDRIKMINQWMPEALKYYKKN